jgi:hypothetical protein
MPYGLVKLTHDISLTDPRPGFLSGCSSEGESHNVLIPHPLMASWVTAVDSASVNIQQTKSEQFSVSWFWTK